MYLLKTAFISVTKVTIFRNMVVLRERLMFSFLAELPLRTQASWASVVESRVLAGGVTQCRLGDWWTSETLAVELVKIPLVLTVGHWVVRLFSSFSSSSTYGGLSANKWCLDRNRAQPCFGNSVFQWSLRLCDGMLVESSCLQCWYVAALFLTCSLIGCLRPSSWRLVGLWCPMCLRKLENGDSPTRAVPAQWWWAELGWFFKTAFLF